MRSLYGSVFALVLVVSAQAASDADVTIIKATKVEIGTNVITIVAEAKARLMLIKGDHEPTREAQWMGRPVTVVHVKADRATFTIKKPEARNLEHAWEMSLQAAKDLQSGKEVGRIGYYGPDISIKRNVIDSMSGFGYLYPKGS